MGTHRAPELTEPTLLAYHDAATGEHVELTASELGGCAAQVAGLLREGCGIGEGGRAAVLLPPHWLTAAVLMGAWSAGLRLSLRGWATAGLQMLEPGADTPYDVLFAAADRVGSWLDDIPDAKHRFSLFADETPEGYRDFEEAIDEFSPYVPAPARTRAGDAVTPDGSSFGEFGAIAAELAGRIGLRGGDRLLVDAATVEHPLKWLLAPLSVGATVLIAANAGPEALETLAASERVTHRLQ